MGLTRRMAIGVLFLVGVLQGGFSSPAPGFPSSGYVIEEGYDPSSYVLPSAALHEGWSSPSSDEGYPSSDGGYSSPSSDEGYPSSDGGYSSPGADPEWISMDTLISEYGGNVPEFKPMPTALTVGEKYLKGGYDDSKGGFEIISTTKTEGGYGSPPPSPDTKSEPATPEKPPLSPKAKIIEGTLTLVDGVVEGVAGHFGPKIKRVVGHFQPKLARVAGHFQPKVARVVGRIRPKFVQVATHYAPAIGKARERLGPVVARVSKGVTTFLSPDPPAPAPAGSTGDTGHPYYLSAPRIARESSAEGKEKVEKENESTTTTTEKPTSE